MPVQSFRKMSAPKDIVLAVYYDGTNLSELIDLGIDFEVVGGEVKIPHYAGYRVVLTVGKWVVMENDPALKVDQQGVVVTSPDVFRAIYGKPLTNQQIAEILNAGDPDPEHMILSSNTLNTGVRGDTRKELEDAALRKGRKVFGPDVALTVKLGAIIESHVPAKSGGDFFTSAEIKVRNF